MRSDLKRARRMGATLEAEHEEVWTAFWLRVLGRLPGDVLDTLSGRPSEDAPEIAQWHRDTLAALTDLGREEAEVFGAETTEEVAEAEAWSDALEVHLQAAESGDLAAWPSGLPSPPHDLEGHEGNEAWLRARYRAATTDPERRAAASCLYTLSLLREAQSATTR